MVNTVFKDHKHSKHMTLKILSELLSRYTHFRPLDNIVTIIEMHKMHKTTFGNFNRFICIKFPTNSLDICHILSDSD